MSEIADAPPPGATPYTSTRTQLREFKIAEARAAFSGIVTDVGAGSSDSVAVGHRGRPEVVVVAYQRFSPLFRRGNKAEKLALLIVEELLADAPQHMKTPAVAELSGLSLGDLEKLWRIDALPLDEGQAEALRGQMENPAVLDRLCQRARVAQVVAEAQASGFYDALEDATSGNVLKVAE